MTLQPLDYLGAQVGRKSLGGGVVCTLTSYPPGQEQPWHEHASPNASFLVRGSFEDESKAIGVCVPQIFSLVVHPANTRHRCVAGPSGRTSLNVEPTAEWLQTNHLEESDLTYRYETCHRQILPLMRIALGVDSLASSALTEVLFGQTGVNTESLSWFRKVDRLLQEDSQHRWTLSSLAREVGVHPVYLARVFRQKHGVSVTEHLHRARVLRAARLIVLGERPGKVAHDIGYADQAHFCRSFKRIIGTTPNSLRRS